MPKWKDIRNRVRIWASYLQSAAWETVQLKGINMSDLGYNKEKKNSTRKCSNCGYPIYEPGFELMVPAVFPKDYELYAFYVTSATVKSKCGQCRTEVPDVDRVYSFVFTPLRKVFIYIPKHSPKEEVDGLKQTLSESISSEFTIEVLDDLKTVRNQAFKTILSLVDIHSLSEVGTLREKDIADLLAPNGPRDKAYHTALFLVSSREQGFIRPTRLPKSTSEDDFWHILKKARASQTAVSFFKLCSNIETSKDILDPLVKIEELFVPGLFDRSALSLITELIPEFTSDQSMLLIIDALLATAAVYGGQKNPRSTEWIKKLIQMLSQDGWPPRLKLTQDTLRKMISEEELFQELVKTGFLGKNPEKLKVAFAIAEKFGYAKEIVTRFKERGRITLGASSVPPEIFIQTLITTARQKGADDSLLGEVLSNISQIKDARYKHRCFELIVDMFAKTKPEVIIPSAQKLSKQMIKEGYPAKALGIVIHTQSKIDWGVLKPSAKARLLTEVGNAYRAMLNYPKAYSVYKEISSLIGNDLNEFIVRVNQMNIARVLRDMGQLADAKKFLLEVLEFTEGLERFDCLFALGIIHQRNGDFYAAQSSYDEARMCIEGAPIDDQIARFYIALVYNQQELGISPDFQHLLAVQDSELVSARLKLLTLGILGSVIPLVNGQDQQLLKVRDLVLEIAKKLPLIEWADTDLEMATQWCSALINIGEDRLAEPIVNKLLIHREEPLISIYVATIATALAARRKDWQQVSQYVMRANQEMVALVKAAGAGETSINVVNTMLSVRRLARFLHLAPKQPEIDELFSAVADLQCSLSLSVDLSSEYLPLPQDFGARSLTMWAEPLRSNALEPLQILQFLDADDDQIPILTRLNKGQVVVKRGDSISTDIISDLGKRINARIMRMPANSNRDPFEGLKPYTSFREQFLSIMKDLGLRKDEPLLVVPSPAAFGLPFQHILANQPIAYVPSVSVSSVLFNRANKELVYPSCIGEVISWRFGENPKLLESMRMGGEELENICSRLQVEYQSVSGLNATQTNVQKLLQKTLWIKLSCHGVADIESGQFAFVLSDGDQNPPGLGDLLDNKELASRYLYSWNEVTRAGGSCKLVFSTACTSGSTVATVGGEQIGMARAFFRSGVVSYIAPLWPVGGRAAQTFINTLIDSCLSKPDVQLATHIRDVRNTLQGHIPNWVGYAFILHGYHGPVEGRKEVSYGR